MNITEHPEFKAIMMAAYDQAYEQGRQDERVSSARLLSLRSHLDRSGSASEGPLKPIGALRELRSWMKFKLEHGPIKHQQPDAVYPMNQHPSGYAAVLVPDWDMRQKLALIEETIGKEG